jgi:hypothetical protein
MTFQLRDLVILAIGDVGVVLLGEVRWTVPSSFDRARRTRSAGRSPHVDFIVTSRPRTPKFESRTPVILQEGASSRSRFPFQSSFRPGGLESRKPMGKSRWGPHLANSRPVLYDREHLGDEHLLYNWKGHPAKRGFFNNIFFNFVIAALLIGERHEHSNPDNIFHEDNARFSGNQI